MYTLKDIVQLCLTFIGEHGDPLGAYPSHSNKGLLFFKFMNFSRFNLISALIVSLTPLAIPRHVRACLFGDVFPPRCDLMHWCVT